MQVTQEMLVWARRRVNETAEAARIAANAHRTAERDLAGLQRGKPTWACIDRWCDSRSNSELQRATTPQNLVSDIESASRALSSAKERIRASRQEAHRLGLLIDEWERKYHDLAKANRAHHRRR